MTQWRPAHIAMLPLLFVSMACCVGCLIVPTPEHGLLEGRGVITEKEIAFVKNGTTTLEEVVVALGEPDWTETDKVFVYRWTVIQGYLIVGDQAAAIPKGYLLLLEFDEQNRVARHQRKAAELFQTFSDVIDQWLGKAGNAR